jgi:hypothetical protein
MGSNNNFNLINSYVSQNINQQINNPKASPLTTNFNVSKSPHKQDYSKASNLTVSHSPNVNQTPDLTNNIPKTSSNQFNLNLTNPILEHSVQSKTKKFECVSTDKGNDFFDELYSKEKNQNEDCSTKLPDKK